MKKTRGFEVVEKAFRKHENVSIQLPIRGDSGSAGYDFFSNETVTLEPGAKHLFWTDVKAYMQTDELLEVHIRSSLGVKYLLVLANGTGIIDSLIMAIREMTAISVFALLTGGPSLY